jgi:hypothetical protein
MPSARTSSGSAEMKSKYDPDNFLRRNNNVLPTG